ncbi:MAG: SPOR domain-containing protein [Tannerella sp.]|jgi:cell division protein FtsN|nr:SPOR domain-containing protein [Tannerella sp.]
MKKILLFGTAICCVFLLGSCKSKSSAYKTAYEQAKSNDGNNWEAEEKEVDDDETEVLTSETVSYESVKQEKVKPATGEEEANLKRYSVVIGSFKNRTNAYALKERMIDEGYRPVVAENDFGMLRVIVASFDSKADAARSRDALKSKYAPNFQDVWLLERKY